MVEGVEIKLERDWFNLRLVQVSAKQQNINKQFIIIFHSFILVYNDLNVVMNQ